MAIISPKTPIVFELLPLSQPYRPLRAVLHACIVPCEGALGELGPLPGDGICQALLVMARNTTGSLYESPNGSGRWHAKFTTTRGRRSIRLASCRTRDEAETCSAFIAGQLARLRAAHRLQFTDKLLELSAHADPENLDRVRRGVDAIVAGTFEEAPSTERAEVGLTFRAFAEQWTSGHLRQRFQDHVAEKRSAADDVYRLNAHIYPMVGDIPLRQFTTEHAELVMRSLPTDRAPGTRRHVAQLLSRVLKLAVYPGRLLDHSPIPPGFLPKPAASKALAWLYPSEESALLADLRPPLLHRLFYGFLAREGLRSGEAAALSWRDLDLEHGTIALDENKTDHPRMWMLGRDVAVALRVWKSLTDAENGSDTVFARNGERIGVEHLAITFRGHLSDLEGIRPILFENTESRRPIRIHDLRATFVTLALGAGRTETWVADRTGHRSSAMLNTYRRAARSAAELELGWLVPLDAAIPELRQNSPNSVSVHGTSHAR